MKYVITLTILVLLVTPALADQVKIKNYRSARDTHFYKKLYKKGGRTLYCNKPFKTKEGLNVEHVYPASWMKDTAGCTGQKREECRKTSDRFNKMEADLHNLFPALARINKDRNNYTFSIIGLDINEPDYGNCDFEIDNIERKAEPRPGARGEIARAIFYMHSEYALPIEPSLFQLLITWNEDDEVSAEEVRRNSVIEKIQGTRNKFIDDPSSVAKLILAEDDSPTDEHWEECRIKGNISQKGRIYHLPGMRYYAQTKINKSIGEMWFCSEEEAKKAGWRRASQ